MKLRVNLIFTLILTLSTFKIYSQKGRNLIGCWQVKTDNNGSKVHWQFEKDSIKYIIISCDKDTREVFNVSVMEGTYKVVGDTIFSKFGKSSESAFPAALTKISSITLTITPL